MKQLKIGNYKIQPIEYERFALDGGAMFGVVPKTLWNRTNPADEKNRIEMALRGLLIVGEGRVILVDVGIGTKWDPKFLEIYKINFEESNVIKSLAETEFSPSDVTDVIISHLHFDHIGGSTKTENGKVVPVFPNAKFHIQKKHWDWAMAPNERDRASFLHDDFVPLLENGLVNFIDGEQEILPNISVLTVHGHTPNQQLPLISDGKTTLLYAADLMPTSSHIPLPYVMAYDLDAIQTVTEKRKILTRAVAENWILFFEHDPYHIAGKIETKKQDFRFAGDEIWRISI